MSGFSVSPGGMEQLERAGEGRYPGVYVTTLGGGDVSPQSVVVTLPPGKGLQFAGNLLVYGKRPDGSFGQLGSYEGTLTPDRQTFTADTSVDLALSDADPTNSLLIGVKAPADAEPGESNLLFTVGDYAPTDAPVNVTTGFSVSPGGLEQLERAGEARYAGVYVTALEKGNVSPQSVVVKLPPGRGLRFAGNLLVFGKKSDGTFGQLGAYEGALTQDGQTFTANSVVDLALSEADSTNSLLIGVKALADAVPGESNLLFAVGDHALTSAPVNVTDT
ncbi:hypothetical protein ACFV4G_38100 [Kitasatospora sp. NPDC059747]|uniref:hypothetical protein n=1 Tax=Kitasatospora sp. NPDC059747 TaxID=3346930 RepID=UPI00365C9A66